MDYTTVYGIAPTVFEHNNQGKIMADSMADNLSDGMTASKSANVEYIGVPYPAGGFDSLQKHDNYVFARDYHANILDINGKNGAPEQTNEWKTQENPNVSINDLVNHFLGRAVDNSHIIEVGNANHTVASFENSDIMVISPNYFQQKHIYTDRGQRMEQYTDKDDLSTGGGAVIRKLYVHEDIMGNTRYHTKDNGQSYAELEYDVWGNPTIPHPHGICAALHM